MALPRLLNRKRSKASDTALPCKNGFHYDNLAEPTKTERFNCASSQFINSARSFCQSWQYQEFQECRHFHIIPGIRNWTGKFVTVSRPLVTKYIHLPAAFPIFSAVTAQLHYCCAFNPCQKVHFRRPIGHKEYKFHRYTPYFLF